MAPSPEIDAHFHARVSLLQELAHLLADALVKTPPLRSYADLYTTGAALQFVSHCNATTGLLHYYFDAEAWIMIRCMAELLVKAKWVRQRKSNAVWIILWAEQADLNKLIHVETRLKGRAKAIAAISTRLAKVKPTLPKNGRFWSKTQAGEIRRLPNTEAMAKESGMLRVYRSWFKMGSYHTHASHRVLERFMILSPERQFEQFSLSPQKWYLIDASHTSICVAGKFILLLKQAGWPVDKKRFLEIANRAKALEPAVPASEK